MVDIDHCVHNSSKYDQSFQLWIHCGLLFLPVAWPGSLFATPIYHENLVEILSCLCLFCHHIKTVAAGKQLFSVVSFNHVSLFEYCFLIPQSTFNLNQLLLFFQLVSCVYITSVFDETSCFLIQLLNLYCIHSEAYDIPTNINEECVTENDPGLVMDTVCFIVALAQYGIFKSKYFRFVIREHRKQSEMSSRSVFDPFDFNALFVISGLVLLYFLG